MNFSSLEEDNTNLSQKTGEVINEKQMRLNLVTFCVINAININIAEAQTEEMLDQINVVEKNVTNDKKPFTEAKLKQKRTYI